MDALTDNRISVLLKTLLGRILQRFICCYYSVFSIYVVICIFNYSYSFVLFINFLNIKFSSIVQKNGCYVYYSRRAIQNCSNFLLENEMYF
jgi:hypothetical protein